MASDPDLTSFDAIEIHGVRDGESGYDRSDADGYCLLGHLPAGGADLISNHRSYETALAAAKRLSAASGLPINVFC